VTDLYDNFEYFASYRVPILRSRFRRAVRESDGVSCVSNALLQHVQGHYGRQKPTAVVTNAVDTSEFRPMDRRACREQLGLPSTGRLVGAAGDISNYRGADTLYQAFAGNGSDLADAHLVVAGYRTQDTKIPESANIIDLGQLRPAEVPVFLNSLDLAVIYNRSSTFGDYCFPQKFFEALACNLPVVVARVGELGQLLKDQPSLFYEDGDAVDLARTINRQLSNLEQASVAVPTWDEQAALLLRLMRTTPGGSENE
jgi:glycosyltransferase involved in cell wall biosynthesis